MINLNGNSSSSRQVTFITHPSIQSKAFASYLSETLMASVVLQNINKPLAQRLAKDSVILFDIAVSNKKLNGVWRDIIRLQADNPRLLIINSAQKYELYEMAQWPALYGVFRHDDDESRLIEGVKAVLNGEQTAELSVMHPAMYAADHASAPVETRYSPSGNVRSSTSCAVGRRIWILPVPCLSARTRCVRTCTMCFVN